MKSRISHEENLGPTQPPVIILGAPGQSRKSIPQGDARFARKSHHTSTSSHGVSGPVFIQDLEARGDRSTSQKAFP